MAAAQQFVFLARLQGQPGGIGHRHFRRRDRQRTIGGGLAAGGMGQHRILRRDFRRFDIPLLGGGGDQHRLGARAGLAQLVPGARDRGRTARALIAIDFRIEVRLLDHDMVPVGVQFLGDDQAESGLDALADFRRLGIDGDGIVGRDADEGVDALGLAGLGGGLRRLGGGESLVRQMEAQHQSGPAGACELEEGPPLHRQRPGTRRGNCLGLAHQLGDIGVGLHESGLGQLGLGKCRDGFSRHGGPPCGAGLESRNMRARR